MSIGNIPLFKALSARMSWLTERQKVLAQNIANADTPGYVPRDLKEPNFAAAMQSVSTTQTATHRAHFTNEDTSARCAVRERVGSYETSPAGNAVILEEQVLKATETAMDYMTVTNLYRRHLAMYKTAIGQGNK
ncbi:MAG: flagellar basal body protein [Pseudomonadota bacterium]|nr:flagellar basal body protein [Pseudomonadota bacterium]